jgi:ubiquinone/menaquinone biosynthesis C-methylase UbiE
MKKYEECIDYWNNIFKHEEIKIPVHKETGNNVLDYGIAWLCEGANTVLDFGCGNGTLLFLCALYGCNNNIGIDASIEAIKQATIRSEKMAVGKYQFIVGGVDYLKQVEEESIDAVILSNIVDNLYPNDAINLLGEITRILKNGGRVLLKLNPYLTSEQIKEYKIRIIKDSLLDDGLLLWNNSTDEWKEIINRFFVIKDYNEIYFKEYNQYNRLFLVEKDNF